MVLGTKGYVQNMNIPTPKILTHTIQDFNGGMNNVSEPKINQAYDLLNMGFSDSVLMEKRTGVKDTGLVTVIPADKKITLIDEYKMFTGAHKLIVSTNENLYVDNVLLTAVGGQVRGTTYMGKYWFVDGVDIRVYDGTTVKKLKNPPAGFTPAPSPAVVGNYRSDATHTWYEPCAAELADTYKGANVIPVAPKYICARKERLYMAGCSDDNDNVFISDIQNGFYFAVGLPLQYNPNGEKITGLKEFMDTVVVGRDESIWAIYGNSNRLDSDDIFKAKQVQSHSGVFNQESMQRMHNFLVFLGNDGIIYRMTTPNSDVRLLTTSVLSQDINIANKPFYMDLKTITSQCAIFHNDEYWIRINNRIFIYNYRHMAWTVFDDMDANYFYNKDGLRVIGNSKGKVMRQKNYFRDIGPGTPQDVIDESQEAYSDGTGTSRTAIDGFWKTKREDMGIPAYYKFFRDISVVTETYKTINAYVDMLFEIDYDNIETSFRVSNRVAVFGISQFGDRFISKEITQSIPTRIGRRGRYISITISNKDIDGPLKIHEIGSDYTIRGRR